MGTSSPSQLGAIRFGVFEVDLRAGELRKQGVKIKLQDQPFQLLQILLERRGDRFIGTVNGSTSSTRAAALPSSAEPSAESWLNRRTLRAGILIGLGSA